MLKIKLSAKELIEWCWCIRYTYPPTLTVHSYLTIVNPEYRNQTKEV